MAIESNGMKIVGGRTTGRGTGYLNCQGQYFGLQTITVDCQLQNANRINSFSINIPYNLLFKVGIHKYSNKTPSKVNLARPGYDFKLL